MTGTAMVKPPHNDAEWARNVEKRLKSTENPTAVRVGDWTLSTHPETGNLIGSNANGGSVVLAVPPDASTNPDTIASTGQPFLKVERQANQQEQRGSAHLVQWDTVAHQTSEWTFTAPGSDIVIPVSGVYRISYHLAFLNSSTVVNKAMVLIDAVVKMAQEFNPTDDGWYHAMYMTEDFPLQAGQLISAAAYASGSGTFDFGASGADPSVFTSLSLLQLPVD